MTIISRIQLVQSIAEEYASATVVNQSPVVFVFQCLAACCLPNRNISITQFFLFKNLPGKRFIKEQYYTTRNANYAPMENEEMICFEEK